MAGSGAGWLPGADGAGPASAPAPAQTIAGASLTPAERRMREQSQAFEKTVWQGALAGTGGTGLLFFLIGEEAALASALFGGAGGALAGSYIAHKQTQCSRKEDLLDAMTTDVRQSNAETQDLIVSAREVIAADERRLAAVQKELVKGQATQAELDNARRRSADNQAIIARASAGAREKQTMFQGAERQYRQDHPGTDTGGMTRALNAYDTNLKALDGLAKRVSVAGGTPP